MSEPTTEQLENAKKFPWQWAIYILLAAISFLYAQNLLKDKKSQDECDNRSTTLQKALSKKDSAIFDWQAKYINLSNELLYKNNILDRQQQVIDNTDSIARKRFEKPAKQIVKDHE
jgi:hypothetical protein